MERRWKFGSVSLREAMCRPRSALGMERTVVGRMPIPRGEDGSGRFRKDIKIPLQSWNDLLAFRHRKSSAGKKIVLYVHHEQRVAWSKVIHGAFYGASLSWLLLSLLHQQPDVGERVLSLGLSQLCLPRMHRTEDNAVLDGPEQLLVRFQEGFEAVEIGRRDP